MDRTKKKERERAHAVKGHRLESQSQSDILNDNNNDNAYNTEVLYK